MLKNITLSIDEELLQRARKKASSENQVLNNLFRQWMADYAQDRDLMADQFMEFKNELVKKKFTVQKSTRDERHER